MQRTQRKGIALPYAMILLLAITFVASLAVDLGRVVLVKAQLRAAADAAALAGGQDLLWDVNVARASAVATAQANKANGAPVTLTYADVVFVNWDEASRAYTPTVSTSRPNAILVTAHCSAARGTAVDLVFGKVLGINTCDVKATAIAMATPQRYAAVGLDFITMGGNATIAYRSNTLNYNNSGNFSANGSIASNGNITLSGSSLVDGNAFPGVGKTVFGASHVTGYTQPLTKPLVYPVADATGVATNNNNGAVPTKFVKNGGISIGNQQILTLPGGTYYFKDLTLSAGGELNFTGPAVIYLTGNLSLGGHATTNADLPKNLRINMLTPGSTVSLSGGTDLFADIYAPVSPMTISGNGDIYGSVVGKSIAMTGEAGIHYDLSLVGGVRLVK